MVQKWQQNNYISTFTYFQSESLNKEVFCKHFLKSLLFSIKCGYNRNSEQICKVSHLFWHFFLLISYLSKHFLTIGNIVSIKPTQREAISSRTHTNSKYVLFQCFFSFLELQMKKPKMLQGLILNYWDDYSLVSLGHFKIGVGACLLPLKPVYDFLNLWY